MKTMRIITVVSLTLVLVLAVGAFAATTAKTTAKTTTATTTTKSHGMAVQGKISALDEKAKTLSVTSDKGAATELTWNDATKVNGGTLKVGERANVRYLHRDGKNVATVIVIPAAKAAAK